MECCFLESGPVVVVWMGEWVGHWVGGGVGDGDGQLRVGHVDQPLCRALNCRLGVWERVGDRVVGDRVQPVE